MSDVSADPQALETAASWLREARHVVAFTGAGVSQESGIPTFRDQGGLWEEFDPETFATMTGLLQVAATRPDQLARFLHGVLEPIASATPNPGHRVLARLEETHEVTVVTQNVDGLHQEAGNRLVYEIHGSFFVVLGAGGERIRTLTRDELLHMTRRLERAQRGPFKRSRVASAVSPLFGLGTGLVHRPSIVLFGEQLAEPDWTHALEAAARCDLVLSVGTSGDVWPANQLPRTASRAGARVVGIGPIELSADLWLKGRAGEVLPALLDAARA